MDNDDQNTLQDLPEGLLPWIETSLDAQINILATSNQGIVLLFEGDGLKLVVKAAMGKGPVRRMREAT